MLKTVFAAALLLGVSSSAFAKTYHGPYTVSFFIDPGSVAGSQYCLQLKPSSGIAGFSTSGTFTDTDGVGLSGQYIVDGKFFHLITLVSPYGDNIGAIGPVKGTSVSGNFDDFASGNYGGSNTDYGSGTFTLVQGCTAAAQRRHPTHHSLTR